MIFEIYKRLCEIALKEFGDIVVKGEIIRLPSGVPLKLRLYLLNDSFIDVWVSKEKYSYHWQKGDLVFRHDNAPHERWKYVKTFPKHFHDGSEENVVESDISDEPEEAVREFLSFVRRKLAEK
ncbi:hypothetical protein DRP05_13820 [Archaeoglobales archaeon]|nr:MAG: hypothetical protein DRP05_13820 [Archaeoglobales archaeon]